MTVCVLHRVLLYSSFVERVSLAQLVLSVETLKDFADCSLCLIDSDRNVCICHLLGGSMDTCQARTRRSFYGNGTSRGPFWCASLCPSRETLSCPFWRRRKAKRPTEGGGCPTSSSCARCKLLSWTVCVCVCGLPKLWRNVNLASLLSCVSPF